MIRISDLEFTTEMREDVWQGHSVQTKTDAHRMIGNERHAQDYIDEFGMGVTNDRLYCNENRVL